MSARGYQRIDHSKAAYVCHVGLGVIVCLSLAMQVHLWAIDAAGEVAAAGFSIVAVFLGIPAMLISVPAIYFSLKAGDRWLMSLVAIWVVLACAVILSASPGFTITVAAIYVLLVIGFGLVRRRKRTSISNDTT